MDEGEENIEIVRTITELARISKMKVVAEGIETHQHLTQLQQLNCDYGQGYLFSRPVNKDQAETFIIHGEPWLPAADEHSPVVVTEPALVTSDAYAI